jgi:hypothetical protein
MFVTNVHIGRFFSEFRRNAEAGRRGGGEARRVGSKEARKLGGWKAGS